MDFKINIDKEKVDQAFNDYIKLLNNKCITGVKVGYFEGKKYENGFEVVKNALIQEKGNERIPPRPFMSNTKENHKKEWKNIFYMNFKRKMKLETNIRVIGELMKRDIAKTIDETLTPPNAPTTAKRKKSSHPLIDTGLLKRSIVYEIIKKK